MFQISVIIPTWNRAKTIKKAIHSALGQTIPPLEILVCDDGSTDNTFNIIKSFKNPKIKWLAGVYTGLPAVPRNRGIKEAKGDWLAFLDSDDEWLPDKLERQLIFANKSKCLAVCCNAFRINKKDKPFKYLNYVKNIISFFDLVKVNYIICSSVVIHKSLLQKCQGFPEDQKFKAIEDYALWIRIATQTDFAYLDENLVNYADNPESSIRKTPYNVCLQRKVILQDFIDWSKKTEIPFKFKSSGFIYYLLSNASLNLKIFGL